MTIPRGFDYASAASCTRWTNLRDNHEARNGRVCASKSAMASALRTPKHRSQKARHRLTERLSGFLLPFGGMPALARCLVQALPLTHFNTLVRGVVLKGAELQDLAPTLLRLTAFRVVAVTIAATRFRKRRG